MRTSVGVIVGLAFCMPCLILLLIAAGIGAGAFSALGAWLADNGLVLGAVATAAVAFVALVVVSWVQRSRATACEKV